MSHFPINFITSPRKRLIRGILIIAGMILVGFSLWRDMSTTLSHKTLWVIDNSLSMMVTDIATRSGTMISRLDLAKEIMIENSPNIVGEQAIMTAAQGARLELPMTNDGGILRDVAHGITPIQRGGGSSLATPLETIRLIYGNIPYLHIIWITDGEFSDSGSSLSGFTNNPSMTFIGVGTRAGGPILLGYDSDGHPKYKESDGTRVNSVRNDTILSSVATILDAKVLTRESDTQLDLDMLASHSSGVLQSLSLLTLLGVFSIIIGLIFSRYQYQPNYSNGK